MNVNDCTGNANSRLNCTLVKQVQLGNVTSGTVSGLNLSTEPGKLYSAVVVAYTLNPALDDVPTPSQFLISLQGRDFTLP